MALKAESDVGVDACGDADVGVAKEFLNHDEVDALFQEQGGGRVAEVVEADPSEPARLRKLRKRGVRLAGLRGRPVGVVKTRPLSRQAGPAVSRSLSCRCLCFLREWMHSVGGDAAFGCPGLGG